MVWPIHSVLDLLIAKRKPFAGKATQMAAVHLVPYERDNDFTISSQLPTGTAQECFTPLLNLCIQDAQVPALLSFVDDSGPSHYDHA